MRPILLLSILAITACGADRHGGDESKAATLDELANRPAQSATAKPEAKAKPEAAHHAPKGPAPLEALTRLSAGNARFANGQRNRSSLVADDAAERAALAGGQQPFAAILTCADSRVPPELLFDQSLGDLFVVRNAGNVAEPVGGGSLEYAIEHLGVRLVIVLGHGSCGAVKAVSGSEGTLPGQLAAIQRAMPGLREYALEQGKAGLPAPAVIATAVERNAVAQAAALLNASEVLRKAVGGGDVAVVPAVYDLASGVVGFLPPARSAKPAEAAAPATHSSH
jgi:carbonic anhydrase